jgi:hypothetical protein
MAISMKSAFLWAEALLFTSFLASASFAQTFSIGVKAGVRMTADFQSSSQMVSESKRYTVGPMVEFTLWRRLGVEVNVLYRRVGRSEFDSGIARDPSWSRDRSNSWEFPILGKYRVMPRSPGPYVSGGYAFRHIQGSGTTTHVSGPSNPQVTEFSYTINYRNSSGLVVGCGVEFKMQRLKISPEFRYTRWFNAAFSTIGSRGLFAQSTQNQADILVGFAWQ